MILIIGRKRTYYKEKCRSLVVASKKTGLDINAGKTKCMVISQDQDAGQSHIVKIENSSFERLDEFKYLVTTLTNQNSN